MPMSATGIYSKRRRSAPVSRFAAGRFTVPTAHLIPPLRPVTGPHSRGPLAACRGFTLLELLVVILIIGIIVSFASLSVGQHASRTLQDEAERIHSLLRLAGEESVLQGRELALQFNPEGYLFVTLDSADWVPVEEDRLFREREMPPDLELSLALEGVEMDLHDSENPPRIFVLSSGEMTPFVLELGNLEGEVYTLQGEFTGKLTLARTGAADDDNW